MQKLTSFIVISALACAPAALAEEATITVDISAISADLAAELDVGASQLPTTVTLSPDVAAVVCGVEVSALTDTCVATTTSTELTTEVESELEIEGSGATDPAPAEQDDSGDSY